MQVPPVHGRSLHQAAMATKSAAAGLRLHTVADLLQGQRQWSGDRRGLFGPQPARTPHHEPQHAAQVAPAQPLTDAEISAVREWIDRGDFSELITSNTMDRPFTAARGAADYRIAQRKHWAFNKPVAAPLPEGESQERGCARRLTSTMLAKLESKGLTYSPDALRTRSCMRRAYLDLTGLPPTPAEIEDFQKNPAYEQLIDRLLASPRYGERWGRQWLDVAGYVDTTGKDFDPKKTEFALGMWRYRDYVIQAFNEDKPWNRFPHRAA